VKPKPVRLRIVLIDHNDKPLASKPYNLVLSGQHKMAKTSDAGLIEVEIPTKLTQAQLSLDLTPPKSAPAPAPAKSAAPKTPPYPSPIVQSDFKDVVEKKAADHVTQWTLAIGSLPSGNTDDGEDARLHNLGFLPVGGRTRTDLVKAYQKKRKLSETASPTEIKNDIRSKHDTL
jgi:hypothetical protein